MHFWKKPWQGGPWQRGGEEGGSQTDPKPFWGEYTEPMEAGKIGKIELSRID